MANRITTIFEVVSDKASTSLRSFREEIANTDGFTNKLKTGWSSATTAIGENAGALAVAGGAALVAFGVKAVGAFTDTAKAAIDLGNATGLSTEAASRWIGVGDDYQVTAEALTAGIGKLGKTLDSGKWEKYGIATRDASGHARDANAVLVDAMATISGIQNPLQQARVGTDLFGKGFAALSPLLGHTKDEYDKMLGSVEKGQVITADEAKKAEEWRLAEDKLKDAIHEITLQAGQQVTALSPLLDILTKVIDVQGRLTGTPQASIPFLDDIGKITDAWHYFTDDAEGAAGAIKHVNDTLDGGEKSWENTTSAAEDTAAATQAYTDQVAKTSDEVRRKIDEMKAKWDELNGKIDAEKAMINYKQQVDNVKQAIVDAGRAELEHGVGSPEAIAAKEAARLKTLDLESTTAQLGQTILGLPPEQVTRLIAEIDRGDLDNLPGIIQGKLDSRTYRINAHLDNIVIDGETHAAGRTSISVNGSTGGVIKAATGGVFPAKPGGWDVNLAEGGQAEAVVPLNSDGSIPGTNGGGGGGPVSVTINMPVGSDGNDVVRAIQKFERRNGSGWRT